MTPTPETIYLRLTVREAAQAVVIAARKHTPEIVALNAALAGAPSLPSPGESEGYDRLVRALADEMARAADKYVYCSGCNGTPCDGFDQRVRRILEEHLP